MTERKRLRVMSIVAHQDDFEFGVAGTFALMRESCGDAVEFRILATTRGASGHHEMGLEQTFRRREAEAEAAAAQIGATYECLTCLDGTHVPAQVFLNRNVLGGLWNAIRRFGPDVIFCPPITRDPLAGIHIDHENTAHAVRMVAYQLIVPHAYPTLGGPAARVGCRPLIINLDDPYAAEGEFHLRQDISSVYETKAQMTLCHASQVFEWLPFTGGNERPIGKQQWLEQLRARHLSANERHRQEDQTMSEYFRITRWGRAPRPGELETLFPRLMVNLYRSSEDP